MICRAYIEVHRYTMSFLCLTRCLLVDMAMAVPMAVPMAKPMAKPKPDSSYIRYNPSLWNLPSPSLTASPTPNAHWIPDTYIDNGLTIYSIEPTSLYVKNSVMTLMNLVFFVFAWIIICYSGR